MFTRSFIAETFKPKIILFSRNVSSHKTDLILCELATGWILTELPLLAPYCLLYRMISSQMNALEGECFCLREISINVNSCWHCCCCMFYSFFILHLLLIVYFLIPFYFLPLMWLYFCLFINHVNKSIIFGFVLM